jgi:hypothetical protein
MKKSKSPRQSNALTPQSLLESQLRQSANNNNNNNNNHNSTKKSNTSTTIPSTKKITLSEMELVSHHPSTSTNSSVLSTSGSTASTSTYESIDVAATAAAAYALAKNGRTSTNTGLSIELLSQILAASGSAISPQLFAPTWNISVSFLINKILSFSKI